MMESEITTKETSSTIEKKQKQVLTDVVTNKVNILLDAGVHTQSEPEAIIDQILKVLEFFDIDEGIFLSYRGKIRSYILIGLVDEWLQTSNLNEKKGIFDLIKILGSEEWLINRKGKHLSKRVAAQAQSGKRLGYEFITSDVPSQNAEVWHDRNQYAEENTDPQKTEQLVQEISLKNQDSFLRWIRAQLHIENSERPFHVKVLTKTTEELAEQLNGTIAFFTHGALCVPSDYDEHLVEHEYIHSQQFGFNFGSNNILGRGLMEAWTEQQTQHPIYYEEQRKILSLIHDQLPHFYEKLKQFSLLTTSDELDSIYIQLLSGFGLKGLISAIRMETDHSCTSDNSNDYHGKFIFKKVHQVEAILDSEKKTECEERYEKLEDTMLGLEDNIKILMLMKDKITDKNEIAAIEKQIHETEFQIAISKVKGNTDGNTVELKKAIDVYLNHLLGIKYYYKEILPELIRAQTKLDSKDFLHILITALESASNTDLYKLCNQFLDDMSTSAIHFVHSKEIWVGTHVLSKNLKKELFNRHTDDYRLGYLSLSSDYELVMDKPTQEQIHDFLDRWNKIKLCISNTPDYSNFDVQILVQIVRILARIDFKVMNTQQRNSVKDDIYWLIKIVKEIPNASQEDQEYVDSAIERTMNNINEWF